MQEAAFREYLDQHFEQGYNQKYRSDILSRCKRVEDVLAIDLHDFDDYEELRDDIYTVAHDKNGRNSLLSAVKRYFDFKSKSV